MGTISVYKIIEKCQKTVNNLICLSLEWEMGFRREKKELHFFIKCLRISFKKKCLFFFSFVGAMKTYDNRVEG